MRKLLLAACGYGFALLLIHYLLPLAWAPWAALGCGLLGLAALLPRHHYRLAASILLLSAALGFGWYFGYYSLIVAPAEAFVGETRTVTVCVSEFAAAYDDYASIRVRSVDETVPHVRMLVYDYDGDMAELRPGDLVELPLKLLSAVQYYREDSDHYLAEGIQLRGYLKGAYRVLGRSAAAWRFFSCYLARAVKEQALACFPRDVSPLMKALLTGDRREYYEDEALYSAMSAAGFSHVVAVSGMHVAFLVSVLGLVLVRRRATALAGIPLVVAFMAMVGFTPSVVRAGVMQILLLTAPLFRRENDPPTSLAAAALLLLLINPIAIASAGLQLSFAAVAGLLLLTPRVFAWLIYDAQGRGRLPKGLWGRLLHGVCAGLAASLGALVFTTPLSALYFGFVPLYSVLTNLLTLWLISLTFILGYPVCLLGLLWQPLGIGLGWLVAWLPRCAVFIVKRIAGLPFAMLSTRGNLGAWWLVFVYLVFGLCYVLRGKGRFRPVLPLCACIFTLTLLTWFPERQLTGQMEMAVVDVGQGQSLAMLTEQGTVVIDCGSIGTAGNAGDVMANFLSDYGRERVDLLILTHFHADHANGVQRLMSRMQVARLMFPVDCEESGDMYGILDYCGQTGTELMPVEENSLVTVDGLELRLYAPLGSEDANEHCLLIRGSYDDFDFLVTGDAPSGVERLLSSYYELGDMELLVVGHHGSRYSTSEVLLDDITPEVAVISVGADNGYGHPTQEVLDRLEARDIQVYRTDLDGTVTITVGETDGEKG